MSGYTNRCLCVRHIRNRTKMAWRVGRADASSTISPERHGSTSDRRTAPRPHYADLTTAPLAARMSTSHFQDRVLVSSLLTSVRADSDRPTQRPASSDVQITVSATGVLRLPDHVCGTRCQSIYGSVTVSDNLNGC